MKPGGYPRQAHAAGLGSPAPQDTFQPVPDKQQLTGTLPAGIGRFPDLVSLELNGNSLTGSLPPEIGSLANLITLNVFSKCLLG